MCMALKVDLSSVCCVANSLSSNRRRQRRSFQLSLSGKQCNELHRCSHKLGNAEVSLYHCIDSRTKLRGKFPVRESGLFAATESFYHCIDSPIKLRGKFPVRESVLFATTEEQPQLTDAEPNALELEDLDPYAEALSSTSDSQDGIQGANGKPGFISFYNCPYKMDDEVNISSLERKQNNLSWFLGPAVLVAFFIFPSLYLRKILSTVFEDSLLTDFLILFFTEALFYCGVAVFLLLIDRLRRPLELKYDVLQRTPTLQLGQRISSVAALILSLLIPMVTMGLVWPWTGPAASATLAPYLVGIVVQFAFERYARYCKSPSWPVIPVVFQVYRLHQLNRAAQLVTALSFTVKGAEMTTHNLEISNSLNTLLSVLQILGVICIWSLSSFLMKVFHGDNNC